MPSVSPQLFLPVCLLTDTFQELSVMDVLVIFLVAVTKYLTSSAMEGGLILAPVEGLTFHQGGEDKAEEGKRPVTLHPQSLSRS